MKTDYALRMIAELARNKDKVLSVRDAAEKNRVPYSFARSIQHDLAKVGIIESIRGAHGGMRLKADPEKTTLLDIVEAIQGKIRLEGCHTAGDGGKPCPYLGSCGFNPIWCGADEIISTYFSSVTISEIVNGTGYPSLPKRFTEPGAFARLGRAAANDLKNK